MRRAASSKPLLTAGGAAAIGILILAGCAGTTAEPPSQPAPADPSVTATAEPPADPSPTAEPPTTADPADPATWVISEDGIGPIVIGADFDAVLAELPESWTTDAENCSWAAWLNDGTHQQYFVRPSDGSSNEIATASIADWEENASADGAPATADGLSIGTTRDEVLTAYPDAVESTSSIGEYTLLALPSDGEATVFFQFRADAEQASAVTVTTAGEPPYEVCA